MTANTYQHAIELIKTDQTAAAIELLLQQAHYLRVLQRSKLILLSSRLKRLQQQKVKGIIDPSQSAYQVRRNRINNDLLQWIDMTRAFRIRPTSWIRWVLIGISLVCFGAYLNFLNAPINKFFLDELYYQPGELVIPIYKTSGYPEKLDFYFGLTPADSAYSLASPELPRLTINPGATQALLVQDHLQWTKRQGIRVILSDPGRYELKIPFSSGENLDTAHLRTCLSIYPSEDEGLITLSEIRWYEHLYFGHWPMVFLLTGILCILGLVALHQFRRALLETI